MTSRDGSRIRTGLARVACVCLSVAAALALGVPAHAAAAWSRHIDVAVANYVSEPDVAMDPAGDAVFMWRQDTPGTTGFRYGALYTRTRSANGALGPIRQLSPRVPEGGEHDLAVDSQGNAYFVWRTWDGPGFQIRARVLTADGTLGPVQTLADTGDTRDYVADPMVAVDPSGRAVFAWGFTRDNGPDLIKIRSRSASGVLSPVQKVASVGHRYYADMGIDSQGRATFVWEAWAVQTNNGLAEYSRDLTPDGALGPVTRVSKIGATGDAPQVAVTPSGRAVFQWSEYKSKPGTMTLLARARAADGALGPIQALGTFDASQNWSSRLALAPTGEAVFCWHADGALHARTMAPGGALAPAKKIASTQYGDCRPGIDAQGNVAFAWSNPLTASKDRVLARSEDPAGDLGPTQALSPPDHNAHPPELAMTPSGHAAVTWFEGGAGFAIQAAFGP